MELSGAIWGQLGPSEAIGSHLGPPAAICSHLQPSRVIWSHLEASEAIWGHLKPHLRSSGAIWSHSASPAFPFKGERGRGRAQRGPKTTHSGRARIWTLQAGLPAFLVPTFYQEALRTYLSLPLTLLLHLRLRLLLILPLLMFLARFLVLCCVSPAPFVFFPLCFPVHC